MNPGKEWHRCREYFILSGCLFLLGFFLQSEGYEKRNIIWWVTASIFIEGNFSGFAIERVQLESNPTGPALHTLYFALTTQHNSYC